MLVCIHEDRPAALVGVKLLVLSLRRHCPDVPLLVSCPSTSPSFSAWLSAFDDVTLLEDSALAGMGWDAKPTLLGGLLDAGHREVVWIDSDVLVARDFRPLLADHPPEELVVTEDFYWGLFQRGSERTRLWGLEPGRSMPCTINTGFVRVTDSHRELLAAWRVLLEDEAYRRAQRRPMQRRPIHMIGDQDVLTALVGSRTFGELPVAFLRRGREIVHYITPAGYTVPERMAGMFGAPPFLVHCIEPKPWSVAEPDGTLRGWYERLALELCPYTTLARSYRGELGEPLPLLARRSWIGTLGRALGHPSLRDLPLSVLHSLGKRIKRGLGRSDWPSPDSHVDPELAVSGQRLIERVARGSR